MRRLVLCADDFAFSEGTSLAILGLAEAGRLSAISCMSASSRWRSDAARLRGLEGRCDIGLHFTLTDLAPLGPMPGLAPDALPMTLGPLLGRAQRRGLDAGAVAAELERQLGAFEEMLGRPPDFVDGHQHVHLFPGARDALLQAFAIGRLDRGRTYVRDCYEPPLAVAKRGTAIGKTLLLSALARPLSLALRAYGIPCNDSFRGVSTFRAGRPVRPAFRAFLRGPGLHPLVMCHPGGPGLAAEDPIARRRPEELAYLQSVQFLEDLEREGMALARFSEASRPFARVGSEGAASE